MDDERDTGKPHLLQIMGNAVMGGMERYAYNLIGHLVSRGFQVVCLCPFESPFTSSLRALNCPVYVTPIRTDPLWNSIQTAVSIVQYHQIDLIHAHMSNAHVLAGIVGGLTRVPVVVSMHDRVLGSEELVISRTTGTNLVAVCQDTFAQALAMGIPPSQVTLIPNGVDLETFRPDDDGKAFRALAGVPQDSPLVGYVGRLSREKGPDQFLRVAQHVSRKRGDVHFALVGDGPLRAELADAVERLGLEATVHLVGPWEAIEKVYPAFDILAVTSRTEAMPLAVLEAMACGRPVVAMGVGGVIELIEVHESGLTVDPGDCFGLAENLLELLEAPERLRQMGQAGRRRVEALHDLRVSTARTVELLRRLANRGRDWNLAPLNGGATNGEYTHRRRSRRG